MPVLYGERLTRNLLRPDIPTAMTPAESRCLYGLALDRKVLEFGSLLGYSTIVMAQSAKMVYAVDPHEGYPLADPKPTLTQFLYNLHRYKVRDRVVPIVSSGQDIAWAFTPKSFGLILIDITRFAAELICLANTLDPDVIAVHDYGIEDWDGATKAVDKYSKETTRKLRFVDTLAILER